jgi:hypothetical protein
MLLPLQGQYRGHLADRRGFDAVKESAHETWPLIKFYVDGLEAGIRFFDKGYNARFIEIRRRELTGYFSEMLIYS